MFSVKAETYRLTLGEDDVRLKLCLPTLKTEGSAFEKSFNAYYGRMKDGFMKYAEGTLVPAAVKRQGAPYGGALNTVLCHESKELLSLYTDVTVNDGRGSRSKRMAVLWHKPTGTIIMPKRLFKGGAKRELAKLLREAAKEKSQSTALPLYDGALRAIGRHFKWEQFYLSPWGAVFFYGGGILCDMPRPFALPLSKEKLSPLVAEEAAVQMWGE